MLCGIGWAGLGYATSLPMLYALYCLAGIGAAFVYSGCDRLGAEVVHGASAGSRPGIMAAGFGGGTALFIPFIASMIRTQRLSGGVHLRPASSRASSSSSSRSSCGIRRAAAAAAKPRRRGSAASASISSRPREMLRTPQFYVLYATFVMMATGGLLVTANAGPMAQVVGHSGRGARRWRRR